MSRRGYCYRTRELVKADVFDHIEIFYNRTRRHSHIGGISPEAFELASKRVSAVSLVPGEIQTSASLCTTIIGGYPKVDYRMCVLSNILT